MAGPRESGMTVASPQIGADDVRPVHDAPRTCTGAPVLAGLDTVDQARNKPTNPAGNEVHPKIRNDRFQLDWAYADECLEAMQVCGREGKMFVHNRCQARILVEFRCDERACSKCAPRRSRRLRRRYEPVVRAFKRPALFSLTIRNVMEARELPAALETLTKGFEKLRRSKAWPKCPGFWVLEITWSAAKGYHPHIHALIDFPWLEDWDRDMGRITHAWRARTGALVHPDLKRPHPRDQEKVEGLYREALKYVTKQWELDDSVLRAILAVIGHRRMCNGFGGFKCAEEEDESGARCPKCHDPLSAAWDNFTRVTMPEKELEEFKASEEYKRVYTGWDYPDRDPAPSPDPDIPLRS